MPVRLQCQQGHVWEFAHDGRSTLPLVADVCPQCGQPSDRVSLASGVTGPGGIGTGPFHAPLLSADAPTVPGYEILGELGHGGMGVVYKARQLSLNRIVALKLPHSGPIATVVLSDRFRAEAEVVARLRHPNIVQVHDFGMHDGRPFFSMEYLDGGSLADRLVDTFVPPRPAARLVATLARAVNAAHLVGVVHRDLKPANVLLAQDGTPKVGDFGLALLLAGGSDAAGVEGTPSYMAPEQAEGQTERIGRATDVYALGAILYRLLTGQPPHEGSNVLEAIEKVVTQTPAPPRRIQSAVPRDLEAICLKCLEKDPAHRYATAIALADDLDRFVAGDAVRARPAPLLERAARAVRRRPALVALGVLLVALAAGVTWYWHTHRRVTVEYYANAITRWGVPEGFGPLTAEQIRHRGQSLRFFKRAGYVERVETINGHGNLADRPMISGPILSEADLNFVSRNVCALDYRRDETGRLTDEIARNALGDEIWSFHFTATDTGLYKDRLGLLFPPVTSGATFVHFVWTPDGLPREQYFLDAANRLRPDARGICGERREFDHRGLTTQLTTLGPDKQPAASAHGPAVARFRHDDQGNITEMTCHEADGRRGTHAQSFFRSKIGFDHWGNLTGMTYFGIDGQRCVRADGYSEYVLGLDDYGDRVTAECRGLDGKPIASGDGFAGLRIRHDDMSHPIEIRYLDVEGLPCANKDGYAILRRTYDKRGIPTQISYFDRCEHLCVSKDGFARRVCSTSDDRVTVTTCLYGSDNQPCYDDSGVSRWTSRYDDRGQEEERRFQTPAGEPFTIPAGIAGWHRRYDEKGNVIEHAFLDVAGRPCAAHTGVARWTAQYGAAGQGSSTSYFSLTGQQMYSSLEVASVVSGSASHKCGLQVGDVLVTYAGTPIDTATSLKKARGAGAAVGLPQELVVRRKGSEIVLLLPPGPMGLTTTTRWAPK